MQRKSFPGATLQVMDKYGNEIVKTVYGEEMKWVSETRLRSSRDCRLASTP